MFNLFAGPEESVSIGRCIDRRPIMAAGEDPWKGIL